MTVPVHKVHELEALREEINATIRGAWLFPSVGQVKGFLGTGTVMFVGERPSTGKFGGPSDTLLYNILERHGVPNSHLTDVIKTQGKVRDPYPTDIAPHRRIFDRELEIVRPDLIIAFGQKVYDLLQFSFATSNFRICQVFHYSYTRYGAIKRSAFEEQL
jgi:uracil-DNA glycosylase